jgi:hypothetical protein
MPKPLTSIVMVGTNNTTLCVVLFVLETVGTKLEATRPHERTTHPQIRQNGHLWCLGQNPTTDFASIQLLAAFTSQGPALQPRTYPHAAHMLPTPLHSMSDDRDATNFLSEGPHSLFFLHSSEANVPLTSYCS